jgi:hypothetical protein
MKAKIARFDANQTPNIANMAFMNAHFACPRLRDSFGHGKIPRLCGHHSLLKPNLPKGVKDPSWNPTGRYWVL